MLTIDQRTDIAQLNAIYLINNLYSDTNVVLDRKYLSSLEILGKNKFRYIGE